ncbi:MAG: AsmA family protein, partial [Pseudomonadales bacterium]|nr:AsmA family protein [Pseudomonadales bacterium]
MKKLIKITAAFIVLVFTVGFAAIIYVLTLDPNDHKDWIAQKFQASTGRHLTLAGDIALTFYPWLGLSLNDISVGNAPDFGPEPFFHADLADIRIKLLPLLQERYEIDTVRLHGAKINLAVNAQGVSNWADLLGEPVPETESKSLQLDKLVLGGVDIREASLTWDDRATDVRYALSHFNASTGELVYGEPIALNLSLDATASRPQLSSRMTVTGSLAYDLDKARYDLDPLSLDMSLSGPRVPEGTAQINLTTGIKLDLKEDTLTIPALELNALDTHLTASVSGHRVQTGTPAWQTSLDLNGEDLALLFQIADIEPLATQLATLSDRAFTLSTRVEADMRSGTITVSTLDGRLLGANVRGDFVASNIQSETPSVRGQLNASGPDLPTLVEVLGQIQGGRDSALSDAGRQLRSVPDKSFALNTDFNADMGSGNITVSTLDIRLLGAAIQGDLLASRVQSETPALRGTLKASGPDLPLLLQIGGQVSGGTESALKQYGSQLRSGVSNRAFSIDAQFDADLQNGNIEVPVLGANMLGFRLEGQLSTRNMQNDDGTLKGSLDLRGDNLGQVLKALDQADLADVVQSMNLSLVAIGDRSDLRISPLNLALVLAGPRIPNSPATVSLQADTLLNLNQESLDLDAFTLKGLGLDVNGKVAASNIFDGPALSGELSIASFNPRRLLQQLNQPLPETADKTVFQSLALSTAFSGSFAAAAEQLDLSKLALTLDQSRFQGSLSVRGFEQPAVEFSLAVDQIDADRYLAPETQTSTSAAPSTEIPVAMLRDLNLKGQLSAGQLTFSQLHLADLSLDIDANKGVLALVPRASLYEGSYSGKLSLDVSGNTPLATIQSSLSTVALGPLLTDFMDASYVSGKGNIELALNSSGADADALKRGLNGSGRIALEDGVLSGVDVGGVLAQVETMIKSKRLLDIQRGQETAFDTFSSTLAITDGVISTRDLAITAPGFGVSGQGTLLDLNDDSLNFSLVTRVDQGTATQDSEEYDIGGYSLPILCTGAISSPSCLPDAGEIIRVAVSGAVQQRLGNLLNRALGGGSQTPAETPAT